MSSKYGEAREFDIVLPVLSMKYDASVTSKEHEELTYASGVDNSYLYGFEQLPNTAQTGLAHGSAGQVRHGCVESRIRCSQ